MRTKYTNLNFYVKAVILLASDVTQQCVLQLTLDLLSVLLTVILVAWNDRNTSEVESRTSRLPGVEGRRN